jgi:DNA replication factor GINS
MNREELYRIWKAEKSEMMLQKLDSSFYAEVRKLLSDCMAASVATGQDRTQKAITEKELMILRRLSTEIAMTRMKKIVDAALAGLNVGTEVLAQEEAEFTKIIAAHIGEYSRFIGELGLGSLSSVEETPEKPARSVLEVVRFISDFPAIIGVDLRTYGPFKSEDIATLPAENASALISQGVVRQVRFSEGITSVPQSA